MEHDDLALAARIEAFELDEPGAVDPFSRRLARENGWSTAYTARVVREYKRFLTLAVTTKQVVSPSEQVDQAWHLHVLHAARYRAFCRDVLGRQLDHGPSDGGAVEQARFVSAYEQTLASYQRHFEEPPPSDVWPNAARRFGIDLAVRRVNTAEHWVLRKPRLWLWLRPRLAVRRRPTQRAALLTGVAGLVSGCSASLSSSAAGPAYLRGVVLLWLTTAGAAYLVKQASLRWAKSTPVALEPYALAQLVGGSELALDSAVSSLIARGSVEFDGLRAAVSAKQAAPSTAPAFEQDVYREIAGKDKLELRQLRNKASALTRELSEQLVSRGLVTAGTAKLPLLLALVAPVVGVLRILSRLGSGKPLSLLVMLTLFTAFLAFKLFSPRRERTALGEATIARARTAHEPLKEGAKAATLAESGLLPAMLALFGGASIVGLSDWSTQLKRADVSHSSSSGCSSCGGDSGGCGGDSGGCGGGCGGCGGH